MLLNKDLMGVMRRGAWILKSQNRKPKSGLVEVVIAFVVIPILFIIFINVVVIHV